MTQNVSRESNTRALASCMTLTTLFVLARTIARIYKERRLAVEDGFCVFALASYLTMCGLYFRIFPELYMTQAVQTGQMAPPADMAQQIESMMGGIFAIQLLFWLTLWSVKFSLLWMIRRLVRGLPIYEKIWLGIVVFTGLTLGGCVISELKSCSTVAAYFGAGTCSTPSDIVAQAASLYYSLAVDIITDILIMAIPIKLLWKLQINRTEKLAVGVTFCFGLITIIAAVVRVVALQTTAGRDAASQIPISWLALWACVEGLVAITVACLPACAIFIRSRVVAATRSGNSAYGYAKGTSNTERDNRARAQSIPLDDRDVRMAYRERAEGGRTRTEVSAWDGDDKGSMESIVKKGGVTVTMEVDVR